MGYGGEFVHLITAAGFSFHLCQPALSPARIQELWKADRGERGGKMFTVEMLITNLPEITGLGVLPPRWHYVGPIYARLSGPVRPAIGAMAEAADYLQTHFGG